MTASLTFTSPSDRDRRAISVAGGVLAAVVVSTIAANLLRTSFSPRLDAWVVQPALWLAPVAIGLLAARDRIVDAVASRGWAYYGFMIGGVQLVATVLVGFAYEFGRSPWSSSTPFTLVGMAWRAGAILLGQEVLRAVLARSLARREVAALLVPSLALAVATLPWGGLHRLLDLDTALPYLATVVLPTGAASLLATYLVLRGGALASLGYLAPLAAFELFAPALPVLPWGVAALINVGVPAYALSKLPDGHDHARVTDDGSTAAGAAAIEVDDGTAETPRQRRELGWVTVGVIWVVLGYFTLGLVGYTPTLINGISMEPRMHTGDLVITRDVDPAELEVGDVIRFRRGNGSIVHRIVEVQTGADGSPEFITQGDNNPAPDSPVASAEVIGREQFHIPYAGLPIYWLRKLLS